MNLKRAKEIVKFLDSLSDAEFRFVNHIVRGTNQNNGDEFVEPIKRKRKKFDKRVKYSDDQIRKAYELMQNGVKFKEISRLTGIKLKSLSSNYLLWRLNKMADKIPANDRIKTY